MGGGDLWGLQGIAALLLLAVVGEAATSYLQFYLTMLVAQTEQGRGVAGVVDGASPRGVEDDAAKDERKALLRRIGYKR